MQPRLTPIEHPQSLAMRLIYWLTKRKFGKVLTPLKVISSRMPVAFSQWSNKIYALEPQLNLPEELMLLVRVHVAQLNTCSFCIDIKQAIGMEKFRNEEKLFQLADYAHSPLFTPAERAALDFAHELTVDKRVGDATFAQAQRHYSDEQLVGVAWLVSTEHVFNLMNVAFRVGSDGLCQLPPVAATRLASATAASQ